MSLLLSVPCTWGAETYSCRTLSKTLNTPCCSQCWMLVTIWLGVWMCVFDYEFELEGSPAGTDVLREHNVTCRRRVRAVCASLLSHGWHSAQGTTPIRTVGKQTPCYILYHTHSVCPYTKWIFPEFLFWSLGVWQLSRKLCFFPCKF